MTARVVKVSADEDSPWAILVRAQHRALAEHRQRCASPWIDWSQSGAPGSAAYCMHCGESFGIFTDADLAELAARGTGDGAR